MASRAWVLLGLVVVAVVLAGVLTGPDRIVLRPGEHPGPIVLEGPVVLRGEPGAVVVAPDGGAGIVVRDADAVTVREVRVRGGEVGVLVERSTRVALDRVAVEGAERWGILARDARVRVTDCTVRALRSPYARGVEVINAEHRGPSVVEGCRVEGPVYEGIVSRLSMVRFSDNVVRGSTERGVAITEMSMGRMEGNLVEGAAATAYLCGDMSHCQVVGNRARDVRAAGPAWLSAQGHGLVVHYHSQAFLRGLATDGLEGEPVLLVLGSSLAPRPVVDPLSGPAVAGMLATVAVVLLLPAGLTLGRGRPWAPLMLTAALAVQLFHQVEHTIQVVQAKVLGLWDAHGLAGVAFDQEWVHLWFNLTLLVALGLGVWGYGRAGRRAWRRRAPLAHGALMGTLGLQGYHVVEHLVKVGQHVLTGAMPAPGLLGSSLDLVWLHFGINAVVTAGLLAGFLGLGIVDDLSSRARSAARGVPLVA